MKITKESTFHCFFEQSGTFKNEFKNLGYKAIDYDILNDYGQTDVQVDLFVETEKAYKGEESVFNSIKPGEYVLAFFPCTYFMESNDLIFRAKSFGMKSWESDKKIEHVMKRHEKLHESYVVLCKLCLVAIKLGINLVIENPATAPHYLTRYWCLEPTFVDLDRSETGDKMKKPTQYWFINCEPKYNFIFEPQIINKTVNLELPRGNLRSEIAPEYANRFIREFILDGD